MLTSRINLRRAVAALLPVSLLWVFAACVLICGWESSAAQGRAGFASTVEVNELRNASGGEDCPEASFLKATTPERATFRPDLQAVSDLPASILSVTSAADAFTFVPLYRRRLNPVPPLELLSALRI
jgi:hypothetical protein